MSNRVNSGLFAVVLVFLTFSLISCGGGLISKFATFIFRVSVGSFDEQGNGASDNPSISSDGRYAVFRSAASNLVPLDGNGQFDIFFRDTQTGETKRVSLDSFGLEANNGSTNPSISSGGRYVAFRSAASNLVASDSNGVDDIFAKDLLTGATIRASVDSAEVQANGVSDNPSITTYGRYVAFWSFATNLVAGDTNGFGDIFLRDTQAGTTIRVSVDSTGLQANGGSDNPTISSDGRYVVFRSAATNLVAADGNGAEDIFRRDIVSGTTIRVSVDSAGAEANGGSFNPSMSPDGRYVVFRSSATNLVAGDTNGVDDVFIRDITGGTTTRVSVDSAGAEANGASNNPTVTANGRYVAFLSSATNLVAGDTNGVDDIFVRDTVDGTTKRVNKNASGVEANAASTDPSISSDGRYVIFVSGASNLVNADTNSVEDVFIALN